MNRNSTEISLKIVAKSSAVADVMVTDLLNELVDTITAILCDRPKETKVARFESEDQSNIGVNSSVGSPNLDLLNQTIHPIYPEITKQQEHDVCAEIGILAHDDQISVRDPRSIFELGLDSIDVIKLSSRLRTKGIELSVSEIIKCQTVISIIENAKRCESKTPRSPSTYNLKMISSQLEEYLMPRLPSTFEEVLPATPLQESMLKEMVDSEFKSYFTLQAFELNEGVEEEKLLRAVDLVVKQSPILRTTFLEVEDPSSSVNYAQIVHKGSSKNWKIDSIIKKGHAKLDELLEVANKKVRKTWASMECNLFGILPVYFGKRKLIIMAISHALYDGGSLPMIHEDIDKAYKNLKIDERPSYKSCLEDVFNSITDEAKEYWKALLHNSPPSKFPNRNLSQIDGLTHTCEQQSKFSLKEIKVFCRKSNITLQTLGQTCWALVLAELMRQLDVVFGTVLACRDTPEAAKAMFPLFNTVAVRSILHGTLDQVLRDMQEKSDTTRQFQHFPLGKAQAYALGSRDNQTKDTTLFDTLFTYQGTRAETLDESDRLYSSIGGSSNVQFAVCVEMEIDDKSDHLYWMTACKDAVRTKEQSEDILNKLDFVLGRIMKNKQEQAITIHPDGISICGSQKFQPRDIARSQKVSKEIPMHNGWSDIELKIREAISAISSLPKEDILKHSTIFQLGLDSITVLKIPGYLKRYEIDLTASEIMKYLTIHDIANHLTGKKKQGQNTTINVDAVLAEAMPSTRESDLRNIYHTSGEFEYMMPATAGQKYMIRRWRNSQDSLFCPAFKFKVPPGFDKERLELAWFNLQRQHDILRTGFLESDTNSTITQVIYKLPAHNVLYIEDGTKLGKRMTKSGLTRLLDPPHRLCIVTDDSEADTSNTDVEMHLMIHHALYDGISIPMLIKQLMALYHSGTSSEPSSSRDNWKTFVATTIQEKNKQAVRDQWVEYLGSAPDAYLPASPEEQKIEDRDQIEVFRPGVSVTGIKSMASKAGVSIDHLLIVSASRFLRIALAGVNPISTRDVNHSGNDLVVGLYLANRFPFSKDLSSLEAPTLNLLPIRITEKHQMAFNSLATAPIVEIAQGVQRDLGKIGSGGMANVGLDEIFEWTGRKIYGFINIVKGMDGSGKDPDWEVIGVTHGDIEERDSKYETQEESFELVMETEGYSRAAPPKINKKMPKVEDCGAYPVSPGFPSCVSYHDVLQIVFICPLITSCNISNDYTSKSQPN